MPIVYGANTYLVSLIWESANFASGSGATVLGFNGPATTPENLSFLADVVGLSWDENLQTVTDADYTLASVRVEGDVDSVEKAFNLAGSLSGTGLPSNCALIRYKKAIGKGPRNGGRNFWPGLLAEAQVDERGTIAPANLTTLTAAFGAFFVDIEAASPAWVESIPQAVTDTSISPPIVPWPEVITSGLRPVIGTQRRRVRP